MDVAARQIQRRQIGARRRARVLAVVRAACERALVPRTRFCAHAAMGGGDDGIDRRGGAARVPFFARCPAARESRITVGDALEMELVTHNRSDEAMTLTEALHTYFGVSDVRAIIVMGLDGVDYLYLADGGRRKRQSGGVTFNGETDRVYLDTAADCVIEDPGYARRIRIAKRGSRSTVVWNPWIEKAAKHGDMGDDGYHKKEKVESANAADDALRIAPGDTHRLWVRYSVEAI